MGKMTPEEEYILGKYIQKFNRKLLKESRNEIHDKTRKSCRCYFKKNHSLRLTDNCSIFHKEQEPIH